MDKTLFIVFEGVDGSGKSTQIELLKSKFTECKLKVMVTREPSDGPIGMLIRNIMMNRMQADQSTMAALFLADRLDHIGNAVNGMKNRLLDGYNIICSRYYFSSYAFQSEYVPVDWVVESNSLCKSYLKPDLIFYLDVDPETCVQRLTRGRVEIEMYENIDKITKAHQGYLTAFDKYGRDENIKIIDGNNDVDKISDDIWQEVEKYLMVHQ
ncbi:MAG: dTMP kinase [Chitinophagaceae bacterium]